MEIDHKKAINFLLLEKFNYAHDNRNHSFNSWCEKKGLIKAKVKHKGHFIRK